MLNWSLTYSSHSCMYVCTYVCMHVCMYVCMYVCICVCVCVCMYVCMYVCMHACMHACMHVCMYVCKRPTDNHKKPTKVKIKVRKLLLTLCSCRRRESSFPAISYWVACQTSNGALVNLFKIPRAVGASRKISSQNLNILYQVLKDHKNPCGMQLVESSYQNCLRRVFCLVVSIIAYYVASVLQEELNVDVHSQ